MSWRKQGVMSKSVSIWFGKEIKSGKMYRRASLKGLCSDMGLFYNTVKKRQDKEGGVTVWVAENLALEIWVEEVLR